MFDVYLCPKGVINLPCCSNRKQNSPFNFPTTRFPQPSTTSHKLPDTPSHSPSKPSHFHLYIADARSVYWTHFGCGTNEFLNLFGPLHSLSSMFTQRSGSSFPKIRSSSSSLSVVQPSFGRSPSPSHALYPLSLKQNTQDHIHRVPPPHVSAFYVRQSFWHRIAARLFCSLSLYL